MNNLPDDMLYEIYSRLHKLYMKDIEEELDDYIWYMNNNLGDDFDEDWGTDMTSDTEETNSDFSSYDSN